MKSTENSQVRSYHAYFAKRKRQRPRRRLLAARALSRAAAKPARDLSLLTESSGAASKAF